MVELAGRELANEAFVVVCGLADRLQEPLVACNALILLAELGPEAADEAFGARLSASLLDLFVALPDRADDLVEVALRVHAWGSAHREALLAEAVQHPGGRLLGEVLLQVINRANKGRRVRAV